MKNKVLFKKIFRLFPLLLLIAILIFLGFWLLKQQMFPFASKPTTQTPMVNTVPTDLSVPQNLLNVPDQATGKIAITGYIGLIGEGFVIVKQDEDGKPGEIIGISEYLVDATESTTIELTRNTALNETLHFSLHKDFNANSMFEPNIDSSVKDTEGKDISITAKVIKEGTPLEETSDAQPLE